MEKVKRFSGWNVQLTSEWPFIKFNPFEDKEPTLNKKPIQLLAENGKISEPKPAPKAAPVSRVKHPKPAAKPVAAPSKPESKPAVKPESKPESTEVILVENYTAKAFVVIGNTKPIKDRLKEAGGRFNRYLKVNDEQTPGWVFSNRRLDDVTQLLNDI